MGKIYVRGAKLYLDYRRPDGTRVQQASGLSVGQEEEARKLLDAVEAQMEIAKRTGAKSGPMTLAHYAATWIDARLKTDQVTADDDKGRLDRYILPALGSRDLLRLKVRDVRDFVRDIKHRKSAKGSPLAPKTIRGIYSTLRTMLHDAEIDEIIPHSPCKLKKGDLPDKVDADPSWRATAVFTREEAETIISDSRLPEDRRVVYALLFLAGVRFGEASALRWKDYDATLSPLGRLNVHKAYSTGLLKEKQTKTNRARLVPVHVALKTMLETWKGSGWREMMGRDPQPEDLVVASRRGKNRNVNHGLKRFHEDLDRLGFRRRRQHDGRRTFISLAIGDGARRDLLHWVTHGADSSIMDLYTTPPWAALCEAVAALKIRYSGVTVAEVIETAKETWRGGRDLNARGIVSRRGMTNETIDQSGSESPISQRVVTPHCNTVTGVALTVGDRVLDTLLDAAESWDRDRDINALRKALILVLQDLG